MTSYFFGQVTPEHAIACGQRALALATSCADRALQVATHFQLGTTYWALNDYERSIEFHRKVITSLEGNELYVRFGLTSLPAVVSRGHLAWCPASRGVFAEAIAHGEEGLRIAEASDHPDSLVRICYEFGHVYLCKGDCSKAITLLERGLNLCGDVSVVFPGIAAQLGYVYGQCGRLTEAMPLLEQAVERGASTHVMSWHALWVAYLSEVCLLANRLEDAQRSAEGALDFAQLHKERGTQAWALRLLGDIAMHRNPPICDQAKAHYLQALTLANELGMRPLQAHCHRGLGTLYGQTSQPEQARAELSMAIEMYRDMAITFWLPETEAALAAVVVSDNPALQ